MASSNGLLVIERLLRDRRGVWAQIVAERQLGELTWQMLASSQLSLAVFGAVLGASNGPLQAVSSAVKLPILFLVTLAICLPTLYLFNLVFGARLMVRQALALVLVSVTVTASLTLAFAPISLFFLLTAPHYAFFKALNVVILALTSVVGLRFLVDGMRALNAGTGPVPAPAGDSHQPEPAALPPAGVPVPVPAGVPAPVGGMPAAVAGMPAQFPPPFPDRVPVPASQPVRPAVRTERPASMALLYVWILLFGFVGTQLAWTLRPFVGSPDMPFQVFRSVEGNFYVDLAHTLSHLF